MTRPGGKLKHVIIGVGAGVLDMHRPALGLATTELVGVSDINTETGYQRAKELDCAFYADYLAMLAETKPDVAVILTPHPFHALMAIDCLQAGAHVLVEKPMAVQAAEADAMVEAASKAGRKAREAPGVVGTCYRCRRAENCLPVALSWRN